MWHAARKQEKKVREVMVDYQKRAERRREHYEKLKGDPHQLLRLNGRKVKLILNPKKSSELDSTLIPWQGDSENMISRYDVRIHLDCIPDRKKQSPPELSKDEKFQAARCCYESYRTLVLNGYQGLSEEMALRQIEVEEMYPSNKKSSDKGHSKSAAIGFSYDGDQQPHYQQPDDQSSDSEEELDLDIDGCSSAQVDRLNVVALDYGIAAGAFTKGLRAEKSELEHRKQVRQNEKEQAVLSGRKSRKERNRLKESQMSHRLPTPPSYASRNSPTYEPYREEREGSSSSSSSSEVEGQVEFITEFGAQDDTKPANESQGKKSHDTEAEERRSKQKRSESSRHRSRSRDGRQSRRRSSSRERRSGRRSRRSRSSSRDYHSRRYHRRRSHSRSRRSHSRSRRSHSRSRRSRSRSPHTSRRNRHRRSRSHSRSRKHSRSRSRSRKRNRSDSRSKRRSRSHSRSRKRSRSARKRSRSDSRSRNRSRSDSRSRKRSRSDSKTRNRSKSASESPASRSRSSSSSSSASRSKQSRSPSKTRTYRTKHSRSSDSSPEMKRKRSESPVNSTSQDREDKRDDKVGGGVKAKLTPREKLMKRMQAQLSKQYKMDKKEQLKKEKVKEAERMEREELLRDQMRKIKDVRDKSEYTFSSKGESYGRSPSRSPTPPSPVRHGIPKLKDPSEFYYGRFL